MPKRARWLPLLWSLLGLLAGTAPSPAADDPLARLTREQRQWLEDVRLILRQEEREAFLALDKEHHRDAFIRAFWRARDLYPETARNEFRETWYARLDEARRNYGNIVEDRARILLLQGAPSAVVKTDCGLLFWPLEIWVYVPLESRFAADLFLIFYQPAAGGTFRFWRPEDGVGVLLAANDVSTLGGEDFVKFVKKVDAFCPVDSEVVLKAIFAVRQEKDNGKLNLVEIPPAPRDNEWLATFDAFSTDLEPDVRPLSAALEVGFPGADGGRTVVRGTLNVTAAGAEAAELAGHRSFNFVLTGEVLRAGEFFESFRYRFDLPAGAASEAVPPLVFERHLRPGDYTLVVKLEDANSGAAWREERALAVPKAGEAAAAAEPGPAGAGAGEVEEAYRSLSGAGTIRIVPPTGEVLTGPLRLEAAVTGTGVRKVEFFLDGKPVLTKARPPYSVELALGSLPRTRVVRAVAYDASGREVASDELTLNEGAQPFVVRLVEPREGQGSAAAIAARAEVKVPDGAELDRIELYLNERRAATLYQPPFVQALAPAPGEEVRFVRAVAYLADGSSTEDLVMVNTRGYGEQVRVQLVEVYAAAADGAGRPVLDLRPEDFTVREDGLEQKVLRFERVEDIPLQAVLVLDTSASMAPSLADLQKAGLEFLERTIRPKDRAAVVTFSDSPVLAAKLTNDVPTLAGTLAGLRAERGTAIWDCLVFALQYLKGAKGQSAVLLVSDGGDRSSRFSYAEALEFARRSGVTIYTLGLGVSKLNLEARNKLSRLAEETGGLAFFPAAGAELPRVYEQIERELRSRYLLVYESTGTGGPETFRTVEVEVARPGIEVKALRGYYP